MEYACFSLKIRLNGFYRFRNIWVKKMLLHIIEICGLHLALSKVEAYSKELSSYLLTVPKVFVAYSLYGWIEVGVQHGMQGSVEEME